MKMPVIFSGHGSPMVALEHNAITQEMNRVGQDVLANFGKPKAILAISAHWFTPGTYIQTAADPDQIYDMYGFPDALYQAKYPVKGYLPLSQAVEQLLGEKVSVNDDWGIDHGTWVVLKHMFPQADIPVVQLSVAQGSTKEAYALGQKLAPLREQGYLLFASGNVVHNLRRVEWDNPGGSPMALRFSQYIAEAVLSRQDEKVLHYKQAQDAAYAVPTLDHFMPLVYALGASQGEKPQLYNHLCNMGSMDMTGYTFGLEKPEA